MQACQGEAACAWEAVLRVVLGWALRRGGRVHMDVHMAVHILEVEHVRVASAVRVLRAVLGVGVAPRRAGYV
jgi:hypothetical protein